MVLARLYHYYPGLDVLKAPAWLLDVLTQCLPMIEAEQAARLANVTRSAMWAKEDSFRRLYDFYVEAATPYKEAQLAVIRPESEAWFKSNGIPYVLIVDEE